MESGLGPHYARRERILRIDRDRDLDRGEHQNLRLEEGKLNENVVHLMGPPTFSSSFFVAIYCIEESFVSCLEMVKFGGSLVF